MTPGRSGGGAAAIAMAIVFALSLEATPRVAAAASEAQSDKRQKRLPSIAEKTQGMRNIDGFFPLFWDDRAGRLWMEISRFNTEALNLTGTAAGLGSNDIGIDGRLKAE